MKFAFRAWSIRTKLMLAILLTSTAAVLVTAAAMIAYEHQRMRRATEADLRAQAGLVGGYAASALAFRDETAGRETLQALWARREIVHACLYTADGKLFVEHDPQKLFEPPAPVPGDVVFDTHYAWLCQPVKLGNDLVGFVHLRADRQPQLAQLRRSLMIALGVSAAALVVALILAMQLQRLIAAPLLALTRAARSVIAKKDYGIRVPRQTRDETGELTDAFNQMLEETARHEADLAASEERYRLLVEAAPEGISVCVGDRVAYINECGVALLGGRGASEIVGRSLFDFLQPDFHPVVATRMKQLIEERKVTPLMEQKFLRLDGSAFDVEVVSVPITYQGKPAVQSFFRDITERKKAEQALAESRRFNERIAETVPDLVYVYDLLAQRNIYVNREIRRILGLSADQFQAESLVRFVHPNDALRLAAHFACLAAANDGEVLEATCRFHDTAGQWHWLQLRDTVFTRLPDGSVLQVIGAAADISARYELEQDLLEISERERARIGQDIHDGLCQQLVGITFIVKLLQDKLRAKGMKEASDVEEIGHLVLEAINQARNISHSLYPAHFLDEGLCDALHELATQVCERCLIHCVADCNEIEPLRDNTQALHLYRIAQEAVNNAVKHANAGQIRIVFRVEKGWLQLTVTDDGVGLADKAFQNGGLGLRIMQYRAHMIGGTLTVGPAKDGGTVVTCRCPV